MNHEFNTKSSHEQQTTNIWMQKEQQQAKKMRGRGEVMQKEQEQHIVFILF